MPATPVTKTAKTGDATPATFPVGFLDRFGDGTSLGALHALISAAGSVINPATSEDFATLIGSLLKVAPQFTNGGNVAVTTATAGGAAFIAFASQAAKQITLVNRTGADLEVQQGAAGVALPLSDGDTYTFYGITNINQLAVRRIDQSSTTVTLAARWEA